MEVFYPLPSSRAFGSSLEWQYERILNEKGFEYISEVRTRDRESKDHSRCLFISNHESRSKGSIPPCSKSYSTVKVAPLNV